MIDRYSRQSLFPGIGEEGQQKLVSSRVVIIGLGTIRLSPGYFNTTGEIDFTLEVIAKIANLEILQKGAAAETVLKMS